MVKLALQNDALTEEQRALMHELERRSLWDKLAPTQRAGWSPQEPTGKQTEFLRLDCLEALYGGAAGGGKSSCLLIAALQYVDRPGYSALILRRTYADLALPDAIMDRAEQWLQGTAARWHDKNKQWRFPSGATLQFGYLEHEKDKYRYQGSAYQFVAFDELTQFTESQYTYLLSRIRRASGSEVPLRMRAASNPGGVGHDWVYQRFVRQQGARAFVPALLEDNPHLDQDEYRAALELLDSTTRAQLLQGLWVRDETGLVYKYDDDRNGIAMPPQGDDIEYVLGVDFGASQDKPSTAFCLVAYSYERPDVVWVVESQARAGMIPYSIAQLIEEYRERYPITHMVGDAGALGKGYVEEFRQRYALPVEAAKKSDKLGFRRLLNGEFERGSCKVVTAANEDLVQELKTLPWDERGLDSAAGADDHLSDAMLYAWRRARYWLAEEPDNRPKRGTAARADWEARQMEEQLEREAERAERTNRRAPW